MFKKAIPVFAEGKEWEKNTHIALRGTLPAGKNALLRIAAVSFWRVFVDGKFAGFGPARTAKGYARVDEIPLGCNGGEIIIEVVGHACRSLSLTYERSFVCAEVEVGGETALATGENFPMYLSAKYVQKAERYSVQRQFGEVCDERTAEPFAPEHLVHAVPVEAPEFLPRRVPVPCYREVNAPCAAVFGTFAHDDTLPCRKNRYSFPPDEYWGIYAEEEIAHKPFRWVQKQAQTPHTKKASFPLTLSAGEYALFDLSRIEVGFIKWCALAERESDVIVAFSELCDGEKFEFTDINCQNVLEYFLPEGEREVMSFEPYTARFAIVFVKTGKITLTNFGVLTYERDMSAAKHIKFGDAALQGVYDAAMATFAHNALDIFTDCPSRERAGWLCDSYFTGKAEYFFFGKNEVEEAFLENYRLYKYDGELPHGVLPMCYPSCVETSGKFIPQWDMWYVLEVCEFLTERSVGADKELFRESVTGILDFLAQYENELGLLENLPSWNFVEWSTANEWVHDVNFPTNFLYAAVLDAAYKLYGGEILPEKAARVRKNALSLSFDGEVFIDNAERKNGALVCTRNSSEACQYYAALFGGIDLDAPEYAHLKAHILDGFESFAQNLGTRAFVPVNAFIGRYLRIMTLLRMGEHEILLENVKAFFGGMVRDTGTLWEYKQKKGSYDHGFASYVAAAIAQACNL